MSATPAPDPAARDNLPINSATIPPNALADSTPENPPRESEPSDTVSNLRKSQQKFQRMMCSTPIRSDSSHSRRTTEEQKDALEDELGPIPKLSADFLKSMYKDIKSDTVIKRFLTRSKLYSFKTKRWLDIPETIEKEKELYEPFVKIISKILAGPGRRTTKGTTKREVVDTHNIRFDHHDDLENPTRPDISIMAVGPSFQKPPLKEGKERAKIGYCNVASVFDVKRDADNSDREQARQLAGYNRQIYISQPNRKFACSAIMTETQVRAVHFDHSGAYMTEFVDIHKDPYTFVRLVLGLSSHNEEDVGPAASVVLMHR
ncbi:hypothetical protein DFP72DRAFT_843094 [Ephemerocybe angulata]|uniref:Fungal-type protein kinase domain-containing protein n=1 Tax=Ephemerocybe angulata TaxID=980116 RepID=A0A8H6I8E2_9AGAR|nr:hypothetical protein DFP72DRAFT_843094 [Tulosesus angulatus]